MRPAKTAEGSVLIMGTMRPAITSAIGASGLFSISEWQVYERKIAGGPENSLYVSVWSRRERVVVFVVLRMKLFLNQKRPVMTMELTYKGNLNSPSPRWDP